MLSMYLIFGLCVHASSELNEKDLKEFKVYIQNPPKFSCSLAEAQQQQTELERATKKIKKERRAQLAPQLVSQIDLIVQTPEHAENFAFWVSFLGKTQYVLALEAFGEQYNHSILHQQILTIIFKKEHDDEGEDFFEWNYCNKHLQNFWKLLLKKLPDKHPLIPRMEELISGRAWKDTLKGYPGPVSLSEILSCNDWAEEFKQGDIPYELRAAPILKCLDIYRVILEFDYQYMPLEELECMIRFYSACLRQLKSVQDLKEIPNKEEWRGLLLLFQELRNKIKNPPLSEQEIQSMENYLSTHPKEEAILAPLREELARSIDTPSDLLKGALLLPAPPQNDKAKNNRNIKPKFNRQGQPIN